MLQEISIFNQQSASESNEKAIAGVTSGFINLNETVTWRGKHFGFYITHKSRITAMNLYDYFVDEMERGKFKSFRHEHFFEEENGITTMKDKLQYETPFGLFGELFDILFLEKHLTQFLLERNKVLKEVSEKQQKVKERTADLNEAIQNKESQEKIDKKKKKLNEAKADLNKALAEQKTK